MKLNIDPSIIFLSTYDKILKEFKHCKSFFCFEMKSLIKAIDIY